jgi:hypothetical protein
MSGATLGVGERALVRISAAADRRNPKRASGLGNQTAGAGRREALPDRSGRSINATTPTEIPCDNDFEELASHRRCVDPPSHREIGPPPAQSMDANPSCHRRRPPAQTHNSREQTQFPRDVSTSTFDTRVFFRLVRIRFLMRNPSGVGDDRPGARFARMTRSRHERPTNPLSKRSAN